MSAHSSNHAEIKTLQDYEGFIWLHHLSSNGAETVYNILNDMLLRFNLDVNDARGQCLDDPGTMIGCKTGLARKSKLEIPKC